MKTFKEASIEHINGIETISEYSDESVYKIGQKDALTTLYQTAISCSVGHDLSSEDTMYVLDACAFTEAYNKLIESL